jgi:hypothetical protein
MIKNYLKRLLIQNRQLLLAQVLAVKGLMQLLMKNRNTGEKWTREEKKRMKRHLRDISKVLPVMLILLLPGGSLLLLVLAAVLDRRAAARRNASSP